MDTIEKDVKLYERQARLDRQITFDEMLIKMYGTQIVNDLGNIKLKFAAVIAAHCFAGTFGDSFLCKLNRLFSEIIKEN